MHLQGDTCLYLMHVQCTVKDNYSYVLINCPVVLELNLKLEFYNIYLNLEMGVTQCCHYITVHV